MARKMPPMGKVKAVPLAKPTPMFKEKAKKPEPDDMPGKMRPAAHFPKQMASAKRAKRLSGVKI